MLFSARAIIFLNVNTVNRRLFLIIVCHKTAAVYWLYSLSIDIKQQGRFFVILETREVLGVKISE